MKPTSAIGTAILMFAGLNSPAATVVGFYTIPVAAGQRVMLGNQLHTTNDTLVGVIPAPPAGAAFYKYDGNFTAYTFDDLDLAWTGNTTLAPGEGGFFLSPVATTLTFVGEVLQGRLTNTLTIGAKCLRTSMVPQAGRITTDLKIPAEPNDVFWPFRYGYTAWTFDDLDLIWSPYEPSVAIGEAFFYLKYPPNVSNLWIRDFTVQ